MPGEPPCPYTILSEHNPGYGKTTTWAKGEDGSLYRCIQSFLGRRVWSRFPPELEPLRLAARRTRKARS